MIVNLITIMGSEVLLKKRGKKRKEKRSMLKLGKQCRVQGAPPGRGRVMQKMKREKEKLLKREKKGGLIEKRKSLCVE